MKAAFLLMSNNLSAIVKKTWWAMLAYAILYAATLYFRLPNKALHDWGLANPSGAFVIQTIVYLLAIIAVAVVGGAIWSWLNGEKFWRDLKNYVIVNLMAVSIEIVFVAIAILLTHYQPQHAWIGLIPLLLSIIALVPMTYVIPHKMLQAKGEKFRFLASYKIGLAHWGGLFTMGLLGGIIVMLLGVFVALPALILGGAQTFSQLGALAGDPLGVPAYFTPMLLLATTAILFVYSYVSTWLGIAYAYLCGAYDTQEKEKKNINMK